MSFEPFDKSRKDPCPICERKTDWCRWTQSGKIVCMFYAQGGLAVPAGWKCITKELTIGRGATFVQDDSAPGDPKERERACEESQKQLEREQKEKAAKSLGIWRLNRSGTHHPRVADYVRARGIDIDQLRL